MRLPILAALALATGLSACGRLGESRLNPFNWFGRSEAGPATLAPRGGYGDALDNRALVAEVTRMEVQRIPGGALVSAAGLPPTQGWWDAELVADNDARPDENGVVTFRFLVAEPRTPRRASTPQSREVTAAAYLSDPKLSGVARIVVLGERNSRSSAR